MCEQAVNSTESSAPHEGPTVPHDEPPCTRIEERLAVHPDEIAIPTSSANQAVIRAEPASAINAQAILHEAPVVFDVGRAIHQSAFILNNEPIAPDLLLRDLDEPDIPGSEENGEMQDEPMDNPDADPDFHPQENGVVQNKPIEDHDADPDLQPTRQWRDAGQTDG
jgi:hypothetical protein